MSIPFIRMAHEMGLGVGDPKDIEILGYDIEQEEPGIFFKKTHLLPRDKAHLPWSV